MKEAVEQRMNTTAARQDRHVGRCVNTVTINMEAAQICKVILGKSNAAGSYDITPKVIHAKKLIRGGSAHLSY
jgi:hypothetical protein